MGELPNDVLAVLFSNLNAAECLKCCVVCTRWNRIAGLGCMTLSVKDPAFYPKRSPVCSPTNIGSVTLVVGHTRTTKKGDGPPTPRISGHFPQPTILRGQGIWSKIVYVSDLLRDFPGVNMCRSRALEAGKIPTLTSNSHFQGAIRVENPMPAPNNLVTLDISSSCMEYGSQACAGHDGPMFVDIIEAKKPRLLKSCLKQLNVSGLSHLQQLSVRGCSRLECLILPAQLQTLDASGCSNLIRIDYSNGIGHGSSLIALNLSGCRLLCHHEYRSFNPRPGLLGPNTMKALRNIVDLDLSQVYQPNALDRTCCDALRSTVCMSTFSLRYGATDELILALARSRSVTTLRLVDVAFSPHVSDEAVECLAKSAPNLERFNLRGCKSITTSCYNRMPVYLERRRRRRKENEAENEATYDEDLFGKCARKGDNLFYFCQNKV